MANKPGVLLVTIDSLRHDAVGCMGFPGARTPNIDTLAQEGVVFRQAISNGPRTPSSFPAILSSVYPLLSSEQGIAENAVTWAEAMREAGYRTAGFNLDNPYLSAKYGYGRGFERYEDFWSGERAGEPKKRRSWRRTKRAVQDWIGRRNLAFLFFLQGLLARRNTPSVKGTLATDKAIEWIAQPDRRPFFCWLHYMEVHYPYLPLGRAPTLGDRLRYLAAILAVTVGAYAYPLRILRQMYADRVSCVDGMVGRLLAALRARGLDRDTIVVVTADHGDMFREHGWFTHGPMPYDELLRVPLIVAGPGRIEPRRIDGQVALIDLAPTLLDILGVAIPASFQGSSFLPLARGNVVGVACACSGATHDGRRRSRLAAHGKYRILSCRTPDWKYIFDEEGPKHELYNLRSDPGERENVFGRERAPAAQMQERMRQHLRMLEEQSAHYRLAPGGAEEDEAVRRRLAALGYL